ncbi:MAG: hydrolase, TatD family [Parcubacteria group bacterium Gr01-1014_8]|nr:MAG: hydrolase, TatD family [Parcubacteria group bacterium Gr01-1014_8]
MKYFDAHTHVNFVAFNEDREATILRAEDAGVAMNVVGTQQDTSRAAVELAEKYDNVYATIGLHPVHTSKSYHDEKELGEGGKAFTSRGEQFDAAVYEQIAASKKVIAIGECGLDYYRLEEDSKKKQEEAFIQHIELANTLQKPLMLHIRNAYADALRVLKTHAKVRGDVHFFAGSWDEAKRFLDLGFTLSFTGVVTFTHDYDEVIKNTPLDMLLSETDAPYVSPVPYRGKRNEPSFVVEVVRRIADIRGESHESVAAQLLLNAEHVFGLNLRAK